MKPIYWILLIIAGIGILYLAYLYSQSIDPAKGSNPNDLGCGGTRLANGDQEEFIIGSTPETQCTRPIYDLSNIAGAKELCFSASNLLLKNGNKVPNAKRVGYKTSKLWRLNRQAGNQFCYVYDPTGKYKKF